MEVYEVIYDSWEDDKGWTEIYLERKWEEIMDWAYEILAFEDNRSLPRYLIVFMLKKMVLLID